MDVSSITTNSAAALSAEQKNQAQKNLTQSADQAAIAKQQADQAAAQRAAADQQAQAQQQQQAQAQKLQMQGSKGGVLNVFA